MIVFAVVIGILVVILFALACCNAAGRAEEISEAFTPAPTATPMPIVHYPVPLDQELQDYIVKTCLEYEISPCIVFAIIGVESNYNSALVGDSGKSYGLMQIYADQHTQRCIRLNTYNLLDARQNVLTGIDYLAELLSTGHDIEWCLSWYNGHGGEPCEYARTVLCNAEQILEGVQVHE